MAAFSIPEKMFLKIENLMCALRAHINRTQIITIAKKKKNKKKYKDGIDKPVICSSVSASQ